MNIQFAMRDEKAGKSLGPDEHAFVMRNILHLVSEQIKEAFKSSANPLTGAISPNARRVEIGVKGPSPYWGFPDGPPR